MGQVWHQNAVIYQVDPGRFFDTNADGNGDLRGVVEKLDYIASLGATTLWLNPFYVSPGRDNGYDVVDHLAVDPRSGSEDDIRWLLEETRKRGMRVIVELVAQHTSDQAYWFQEARKTPQSPFRDFYIWSDTPEPNEPAPMFPTVEPSIWRWDEEAGQYYRHLFYHHEPDLNLSNPLVVAEVDRILLYWADMGVAGFRIDAASHMVEQAGAGQKETGYALFDRFHDLLMPRNPDTILLGEVDVSVEEMKHYFDEGERLTTLLTFWINKNIFLAMAREDASPLCKALEELPVPPERCGYCFWLRNHDELDMEDLDPEDYAFVMDKYAPDEEMRIYGRGIRRRLAPMLDGDERHLAMAHALLFSLPGTPVIRYGDDIWMGDELRLPDRESLRTPMQWDDTPGAGFSSADPQQFISPIIDSGKYGYKHINVAEQQARSGSLLQRIRELVHVWRELPEIHYHCFTHVTLSHKSVYAVRYRDENAATLMFINLSSQPVEFGCDEAEGLAGAQEVLADDNYDAPGTHLRLNGYGYRWLRLR